jgi:hypothetical protein
MILDLSPRDRHAAIKSITLAIAAMDAVPERRRPNADREAIMRLLRQFEPSDQEAALYGRAADWILREIVTDAVAECAVIERSEHGPVE